jgi:hypothetical protein
MKDLTKGVMIVLIVGTFVSAGIWGTLTLGQRLAAERENADRQAYSVWRKLNPGMPLSYEEWDVARRYRLLNTARKETAK